ncbi:MAG: bifunctional acetate--CoA ligase family protein/GNAT family N-acetyltransferase [Nisaea sp.]|uniref:bifunctional acetate--CoA ligase family protein/GNAT family N-acetyltransferase n=1 Tax=Nisaea sp. TaxID=2024842 RepID=UPI001B0BAD91|nr:bifunctional acetate--CoA ligase family protein/GNAT family N-acetyltransferase [Nisaea sp.]MBO6562837.1 bifunctional acetate--CoA ligase family protein/GNAT family N-acetyltransferase [Nisaea sp.]
MSIRNLDKLFNPKSVAIIGASNRDQSVGKVLSRNLLGDTFNGPVLPVNPHENAIGSTLCYRSIGSLPMVPDLAVICTPAATVPTVLEELAANGTRAAVVVTAGFGEADGEGADLAQEIKRIKAQYPLRVVGPNCVGIMVPPIGLNASFLHIQPPAGNLAFVTQSGAVASAVVDHAAHHNIGFSHVVSLGNMTDVDFGDMLDYLVADPNTKAILLYIESISSPRKFMSAARAAARNKPVIAIKSGRNAAAAKAAASHTGALAGSDEVYHAAFRRAGILRVYDLLELFDAVNTLGTGLKAASDRLAIVTNGGGLGVLATETLIEQGGRLAELAPETVEALNAKLPHTWSRGNPIDIIGDAPPERYEAALEEVVKDPNVDAVLVLNCPTAIADSVMAAEKVRAVIAKKPRVPILTNWVGEGAQEEAKKAFYAASVPSYNTPNQAVTGFMHLVRYKRRRDLLMQTPPSLPEGYHPETEKARAIINRALAEEREWLSEPEAKDLLDCYGIPVVETLIAKDPEEAGLAAVELGNHVVLKILSHDITHKSDVGGVRLDLTGRQQVVNAADEMLRTVRNVNPEARIEGFAVQRMATMPHAEELIIGISTDEIFGPVILFGKGGVEVEVAKDSSVALPPLNIPLAQDLVQRTRVWSLLQGYRNRPPAAVEELVSALVKLSQIAMDFPEIRELDVNPLYINDRGILALDARVRVQKAEDAVPVAIEPYPKHLERHISLDSGLALNVRPIRPEDEPALLQLIEKSSLDDLRRRFFAPIKTLPHETAARLTQIDYDREMALVAESHGEILGVARLTADPHFETCEFAALVRTDQQGQGLGRRLMGDLIRHAHSRGLKKMIGYVMAENKGMLALCRDLGFTETASPDDVGTRLVTLDIAR